jgi:hypothetical protein
MTVKNDHDIFGKQAGTGNETGDDNEAFNSTN